MARSYQKKQPDAGNAAYEENEKITKVLKVQIYPADEQRKLLSRTMTQFMLACDYLSSKAFHHNSNTCNFHLLMNMCYLCNLYHNDQEEHSEHV